MTRFQGLTLQDLKLLDLAHDAMKEQSTRQKLDRFEELKGANLGNERWFEWELYYKLLQRSDLGWTRKKVKRQTENKKGDIIDLQFDLPSNESYFVELKAIVSEKGTKIDARNWCSQHPDADSYLFLSIRHPKLMGWIGDNIKPLECWTAEKMHGEFSIKKKDGSIGKFEVLIKGIDDLWMVGIVKKIGQHKK